MTNTVNIIFSDEKLKVFSKIRNKTRMPTLTTFIHFSFRNSSHGNQIRKINKGIQIGKEIIKISLLVSDMIPYIENSKDATSKLLDLINELGKVAGCKTNIQISIAFLYTNNKRSEGEIKEAISFTIASKR